MEKISATIAKFQFFATQNQNAEERLEKFWLRKCAGAVLSSAIWLGYALDDFGILPNQHLIGIRSLMKLSFLEQSTRKQHGVVEHHDEDIAGVSCRIYRPRNRPIATKLPVVVFFHGGGGCVGSTQAYHHFTMSLCKSLDKVILVSVDYRLAPENPFPAGLDDCSAVTIALLLADRNPIAVGSLAGSIDTSKIAIGGDSAGGNFAGAIALDLIRSDMSPPLAGVLMISPWLQAVTTAYRSSAENAIHNPIPSGFGYFLAMYAGCQPTRQVCDAINNNETLAKDVYDRLLPYVMPPWLLAENPSKYHSEKHLRKPSKLAVKIPAEISKLAANVRAWPLLAEDAELARFPPVFVQSCSHDILATENLVFVERLRHAGVATVVHSHLQSAEHVETITGRFFDSKSGRRGYKESVEFLKSVLFD